MRKLLRPAFFLLVCLTAFTCGAAVPDHAVAFIYHRFGDARYPSTNTRMDQFRAQLDWLAANHYEVWPLPRIVEYLKDGKPIPDHVVAITVDDAFQSFYDHAYPLLKARGWPFTVFVSTEPVDAKSSDFMTWDELREMAKNGADYGDHTVDHGHLPFRLHGETDMAWADRVRADIEDAQARLQTELGKDVNSNPKLFAYPYGAHHWMPAHCRGFLSMNITGMCRVLLSEPRPCRCPSSPSHPGIRSWATRIRRGWRSIWKRARSRRSLCIAS